MKFDTPSKEHVFGGVFLLNVKKGKWRMESRYNFWSSTEQGQALLFNGRTGAMLCFPDAVEEDRIRQTLRGDSDYQQSLLKRMGFLWDGTAQSEAEAVLARRNEMFQRDEPAELMISPTYGCNFRCTYCYVCFDNYKMNAEAEERVLKYCRGFIDKFPKVNLTWFGGEPLLVWEQVARISRQLAVYATESKRSLNLLITTNGYLLNEKVMRTLYNAGVRYIHVTIDGCDQGQDTRRVMQDGSATYQKVLHNFIDAMQTYPDLNGTLRMNLEPDSISLAHELLQKIPKSLRGRIAVHPTPVIWDGVIRDNQFFCNVAGVVSHALDEGYAYYDNDISIGRRRHCNAECADYFQIGPKGELHKCSPSNKPEVTVGHINENGEPVYHENKIAWENASKPDKQCFNCKFLCFCQGGCRLDRVRGEHDPRCHENYIAITQHIANYYKAHMRNRNNER